MYLKAMVEPEIATTNRHMFLYGKNTPQREKTLKTIADKYPFIIGKDIPCVVYIDDIGLPAIKKSTSNLDKDKINSIAMYYLEFAIIEAILNKIYLIEIPKDFYEKITEIFSYFSKKEYENLSELIDGVKAGKNFWSDFFDSYLNIGDEDFYDRNSDRYDIVFAPFINSFTEELLEAASNKSAFQLIFDRKKEISIYSVQAINSLLGLRCNGSMNVKVACECDEWEHTGDCYGNVAEYVHDYTILELDNSLKEMMNKCREEFLNG